MEIFFNHPELATAAATIFAAVLTFFGGVIKIYFSMRKAPTSDKKFSQVAQQITSVAVTKGIFWVLVFLVIVSSGQLFLFLQKGIFSAYGTTPTDFADKSAMLHPDQSKAYEQQIRNYKTQISDLEEKVKSRDTKIQQLTEEQEQSNDRTIKLRNQIEKQDDALSQSKNQGRQKDKRISSLQNRNTQLINQKNSLVEVLIYSTKPQAQCTRRVEKALSENGFTEIKIELMQNINQNDITYYRNETHSIASICEEILNSLDCLPGTFSKSRQINKENRHKIIIWLKS